MTISPRLKWRLVLALLVFATAWMLSRQFQPSGSGEPIVQLRANGGTATFINQGAPVRLDVTVTAVPDHRIVVGSRLRPWYRQIHLETADGRQLSWRIDEPAPPRSTRMAVKPKARIDIRRTVLAAAPLDGAHEHTMTFAVPPEGTKSLAPGPHQIHAVLEAPFWMVWTWRGRVISKPVVIEIRDADPSLEASRLSATADYYMRRRRYNDARPIVDLLVQRDPKQSGPQVLLGEVLEGLGDRQGAIEAYTRALHLMPKTYEEPVDLIYRVGRLAAGGRRPSGQ